MRSKKIGVLLSMVIVLCSVIYVTKFKGKVKGRGKTLEQLEKEFGIISVKPKKIVHPKRPKARIRKKAKTLEQLERELGIVFHFFGEKCFNFIIQVALITL